MTTDLYIAPVQGHTDAAWRHFHNEVYGGHHLYFTPFMRCEDGAMRRQDLRDFLSPLGDNVDVEPQVIFRDMAELRVLLAALRDAGASKVNLNMCCPFPLQTGKGRGAGFIANVGEARLLPETLAEFPELNFSAKMRLGFENPDEFKDIMPILRDIPFRFLAMHPRVAKQQYGGELYLDRFEEFLHGSTAPVIFNGDIRTPGDVTDIKERFPEISGVMTARGVLGRPSLLTECTSGEEWSVERRLKEMLRFHRLLLEHYTEVLCGEAQLLSKIKPFWEYAEDEIGRKAWKAIRKATNIAKYHSAVALIN